MILSTVSPPTPELQKCKFFWCTSQSPGLNLIDMLSCDCKPTVHAQIHSSVTYLKCWSKIPSRRREIPFEISPSGVDSCCNQGHVGLNRFYHLQNKIID